MKIGNSVFTQNEGGNVLYALRERYGNLSESVLLKYAAREVTELQRQARMNNKEHAQLSSNNARAEIIDFSNTRRSVIVQVSNYKQFRKKYTYGQQVSITSPFA